uniref:Uncharacterized protein n=1 Tax=Elizabethkingia anophelis TaxID=1117645 RepID=A0A455ZIN2_9FLAO|nr:TPA_exp: hypothetical protein [Elizabethkingia anophelis]
MKRKIISGIILPPEEKKQKQLHRQLMEFVEWMKWEKDSSEIRKDKRRSVPVSELSMLF